jgi:hypothetical protein
MGLFDFLQRNCLRLKAGFDGRERTPTARPNRSSAAASATPPASFAAASATAPSLPMTTSRSRPPAISCAA